jgi:aminopeptidase N
VLKPASFLAGAFIVVLALASCAKPFPKAPTAPPGPGQAVRLPDDAVPVAYRIEVTPDASRLTFTGNAAIDVDVRRPTRAIVLNVNELSLSHVTLDGHPAANVSLDASAQTASLSFDRDVAPGRHVLAIDYNGKINQAGTGLFALDYDTGGGRQRLLATQFENVDARRFVPCWDEPARKATFQLTVVAPQDRMVVSNTPAASEQALGAGLKRVTFQPTPRMSSYLLFLAVGDLERISRNVDGVDVGVVTRKGAADRGRFALDRASELLAYYDRYFGIRYPLPKLDLVAAPGAGSFSAMENWGAIFFFEDAILTDPRLNTEYDRRRAAIVIAHEMAHQWFGDLVTMAWWDDLWLNEGFASWMEAKAVTDLHPDWRMWLYKARGRQGAMRLDATSATHPVARPAETLDQVNEIGDSITYNKGAAVVRMLEAYVGEDAWREGVRRYLRRYAYANSTGADFWREMDAVSGAPVSGVAHDFTVQDGLPMIEVQAADDQGNQPGVILSQRRFAADAGSQAQRRWRIPVEARPAAGGAPAKVLVGEGPPTTLQSSGPGPVIVNPGQVGYYRTLYSPHAFAPLEKRLGGLAPEDQLGLVDDGWALCQAGYAPAANLMVLLDRLPPDSDPRVWAFALSVIFDIDSIYRGQPGAAAYRAWASNRLEAVLGRIGWVARSPDDTASVLRGDLLTTLGQLGDPKVISEARRRFERFRKDPSSLPADIRQGVLNVVGRNADAAMFDTLESLARSSKDPAEQEQYLLAIARVADPALAQRALDFSLGPDVPDTLTSKMMYNVSDEHPELAWRYALAHERQLAPRLDPALRLFFAPQLANLSTDPAMAHAVHAYAVKTFPPGGRREAEKDVARILQRADVRQKRLPDIDRWLNSRG